MTRTVSRAAARVRRRGIFPALNLTAVVLVALLDWAMPAGIVVGLLMGVPIVLSSTAEDIRELWLTSAVAILAFVLAAIFGSGPVSPAEVWFPNRIIAFASLLAFISIGVMLHRRRTQLERARDEAVRASALSQLLTSLLAHDLRSPLLLAVGAIEMLERDGPAADPELAGEVRARLTRNLRTIDDLLGVARAQVDQPLDHARKAISAAELRATLAAEVRSFEPEAGRGGKKLVLDVEELGEGTYRLDDGVLRRMLSILLDNAIRHARPGGITVAARSAAGGSLRITVRDAGPGPKASRGSGLGLQLCRSLAEYSGGSLETGSAEDGTEVHLTVPAAG